MEVISYIIQLLPASHHDTLYVLLEFLSKVARFSTDVISKDGKVVFVGNKMDSNNLATIFAPNLLHFSQSANTNQQTIQERLDAINVIRYNSILC